MRKLSHLIIEKHREPNGVQEVAGPASELDEKTVFHVFQVIVRREYGARGATHLMPHRYHAKKLSVLAGSALWAGELAAHQAHLIETLNTELGQEAVTAIQVKHRFAS